MLYESALASGLLGAYVQATSGGALYRKSTFLLDSLGKRVLPEHIDIREDPHVQRGKGSAPFDDEGVATRPAQVVDAGVVGSYFLSSYSARKLGMRTTGHAAPHNLTRTSRRTAPATTSTRCRASRPGLVRDRADWAGDHYFPATTRAAPPGSGRERQDRFPVHEVTCGTCADFASI